MIFFPLLNDQLQDKHLCQGEPGSTPGCSAVRKVGDLALFISICKLMQFQSQPKPSDKETGVIIINHKLNASGSLFGRLIKGKKKRGGGRMFPAVTHVFGLQMSLEIAGWCVPAQVAA